MAGYRVASQATSTVTRPSQLRRQLQQPLQRRPTQPGVHRPGEGHRLRQKKDCFRSVIALISSAATTSYWKTRRVPQLPATSGSLAAHGHGHFRPQFYVDFHADPDRSWGGIRVGRFYTLMGFEAAPLMISIRTTTVLLRYALHPHGCDGSVHLGDTVDLNNAVVRGWDVALADTNDTFSYTGSLVWNSCDRDKTSLSWITTPEQVNNNRNNEPASVRTTRTSLAATTSGDSSTADTYFGSRTPPAMRIAVSVAEWAATPLTFLRRQPPAGARCYSGGSMTMTLAPLSPTATTVAHAGIVRATPVASTKSPSVLEPYQNLHPPGFVAIGSTARQLTAAPAGFNDQRDNLRSCRV
jgi:hypothetical protein